MDFSTTIKGHYLEYIEDGHIYLCDGIQIPSITQILKVRFGNKYRNVNKQVLKQAAEKGVEVHEAIENYCRTGTESSLPELRNFIFLQRKFGFEVEANELPVILFDGEPIAAGRLDLLIRENGVLGVADIKRTASLDKDYLFYQLNLYRIAVSQSYDKEPQILRAIWLRDDIRRYVNINVDDIYPFYLLDEYRGVGNESTESN